MAFATQRLLARTTTRATAAQLFATAFSGNNQTMARTFSSSSVRGEMGRRPPRQARQSDGDKRRRRGGNDSSSSLRRAVYDEVRQVFQKNQSSAFPKKNKNKNNKNNNRRRTSRNNHYESPVERILAAAAGDVDSSTASLPPLPQQQQQPHATQSPPQARQAFSITSSLQQEQQHLTTFEQVLERVAKSEKFRRLHTRKPIPMDVAQPVIDYLGRQEPLQDFDMELPTFQAVLQDGNDDYGDGTTTTTTTTTSTANDNNDQEGPGQRLKEEVGEQRYRFQRQMLWSDEQYALMAGAIHQMASLCAKHGLGPPVQVLWHKTKEAGILNKKLLHTLLHVAATFLPGNRRKRALYGKYAGGSILQILDTEADDEKNNSSLSDKEDLTDIVDEIAIYHDLQFEPTEQSLIVRSRLLIAQGKARQAEELLNRHAGQTELHLRTFMPLLRMYLDQGDLGAALRVYTKMRDLSPVHLDTETYVNVIAGIAERGGFNPSMPPIEGVTELGFASASGPALLNELVTQMKHDILEIPTALARRLYNAFADGFPDSGLEKLTSLAPLKINSQPMQDQDAVLADLVPIDPFTGQCKRTGIIMRLEHLSESQVERLTQGVLKLADERQAEYLNKLSRHKPTTWRGEAVDRLNSFLRWLDQREGEPFTVIIDGPNVGYYMQNFETGRFSYHQVEFVMKSLEEAGERPLVVMPRKYTFDFFSVSIGSHSGIGSWKQRLTSAEKRIRTELMDSGKIAVVPSGFLDDYYWILASVSQQNASRQGRDLTVLPDDPSGRWPGTRPVLITNDQMRDHRLGMLEPMLFRRWYSNYIVNYNFPAFVGGQCSHPEIGFSPADFFSREIQCNQMTDDSNVWHFPVSDQQDVWFCLSIRNKEAQQDGTTRRRAGF